jgi:Mn-dependent DtxR family transcriptional regulator
MLIHDPAVRAEKTRKKYATILSHLRDHTYASRKILSQLIDLSESSGFKTLEAMIKRGWIIKYK